MALRSAKEAEAGAFGVLLVFLGAAIAFSSGLGPSPSLSISEFQCEGRVPNNVAIHELRLL